MANYESAYTGAQLDNGIKGGLSVGDVTQLKTDNKTSVVDAINEIDGLVADAPNASGDLSVQDEPVSITVDGITVQARTSQGTFFYVGISANRTITPVDAYLTAYGTNQNALLPLEGITLDSDIEEFTPLTIGVQRRIVLDITTPEYIYAFEGVAPSNLTRAVGWLKTRVKRTIQP